MWVAGCGLWAGAQTGMVYCENEDDGTRTSAFRLADAILLRSDVKPKYPALRVMAPSADEHAPRAMADGSLVCGGFEREQTTIFSRRGKVGSVTASKYPITFERHLTDLLE